jgi:hypothetical protein
VRAPVPGTARGGQVAQPTPSTVASSRASLTAAARSVRSTASRALRIAARTAPEPEGRRLEDRVQPGVMETAADKGGSRHQRGRQNADAIDE